MKSEKTQNKAKPKELKKQIKSDSIGAEKRAEKKETKLISFLPTRFRFAYIVATLVFVALAFSAFSVQISNADKLRKEADARSLRTQKVDAIRGKILDRNGNWLAVSVAMKSIVLDPKEVLDTGSLKEVELWNALAKELNIPLSKIKEKISQKPNSRFVYLDRLVSPSIAEYTKKLKIPGVFLKTEYRRFYPNSEETAHLVGYSSIDGEGLGGVEKSFNSLLIGKAGSRTYRKDNQGNVLDHLSDKEKLAAHNIKLSIDANLQAMAYRRIKKAVEDNKATSGSAVLVDIRTGEILAMATAPSFNPNNLSSSTAELRRNRAITDTFEPGSTVKPFVVLTALEQGIIKPDSVIDTKPFRVNGHLIRDVGHYNKLSIAGILQKSSNIGVSHLSLAMPIDTLLKTYSEVGLGKSINLGLIGEQKGFLPHRKRWADIERATLAYGYGLMVTPVQLARAYATLGSYGIYRPLSITKVDPPITGKRVLPEKLTKEVLKMMETVALPGGGGIAAAIPNYRVAVKTGTAKKIENGRYVDKYISYTAGVAPASNPRYALVIIIDEPTAGKYYGGAISAPVFSSIMGNTLRQENIKPDAMTKLETAERIIPLNHQRAANMISSNGDE